MQTFRQADRHRETDGQTAHHDRLWRHSHNGGNLNLNLRRLLLLGICSKILDFVRGRETVEDIFGHGRSMQYGESRHGRRLRPCYVATVIIIIIIVIIVIFLLLLLLLLLLVMQYGESRQGRRLRPGYVATVYFVCFCNYYFAFF